MTWNMREKNIFTIHVAKKTLYKFYRSVGVTKMHVIFQISFSTRYCAKLQTYLQSDVAKTFRDLKLETVLTHLKNESNWVI